MRLLKEQLRINIDTLFDSALLINRRRSGCCNCYCRRFRRCKCRLYGGGVVTHKVVAVPVVLRVTP